MRRAFITQRMLHVEKPKDGDAAPQMPQQDPMAMMGMMKQNMAFMVPNMLLMGWVSYFFFLFARPVLLRGREAPLTYEMLDPLFQREEYASNVAVVNELWDKELRRWNHGKGPKPRFLPLFWKLCGKEFLVMNLFRLFADVAFLAQPMLMHEFLDKMPTGDSFTGSLYGAALTTVGAVGGRDGVEEEMEATMAVGRLWQGRLGSRSKTTTMGSGCMGARSRGSMTESDGGRRDKRAGTQAARPSEQIVVLVLP